MKQRLVMKYDSGEYDYEENIRPIEYDSVESAYKSFSDEYGKAKLIYFSLNDHEKLSDHIQEWKDKQDALYTQVDKHQYAGDFIWSGIQFNIWDFPNKMPTFLTLDEWYGNNSLK